MLPLWLQKKTPYLYNFNGSNLNNWHRAFTAVQNGTRNARIMCVGDSTTAGQGTSPYYTYSYPTRLTIALNNYVVANRSSFNGSILQTATDIWTYVGAWSGGNASFMGVCAQNGNNVDTATFAPPNAVDTLEIWWNRGAAQGSMDVKIDGVLNQTIVQTGATGLGHTVISTTLGVHTFAFTPNPHDASVCLALAYNSAIKEVSVINMGCAGCTVANVATNSNPYNPRSTLTAANYAPDLIILGPLGINSVDALTATDTIRASYQSIIADFKNSGADIVLVSLLPGAFVANTEVPQIQMNQAMYALADANNLPLVDSFNLVGGSWGVMNARGLSLDTLHPKAAGYQIEVDTLVPALLPGFRSY